MATVHVSATIAAFAGRPWTRRDPAARGATASPGFAATIPRRSLVASSGRLFSARRVARAVLSDRQASGLDSDDIPLETKYSWQVGGSNDIPIVHLRDVYRGAEPLVPIPSPFCTKSSCPVPGMPVGDRTPLNLNRVFVSEDDRVLLKSMAFGCVPTSPSRRPRDPPPRTRPPSPPAHSAFSRTFSRGGVPFL